MAIFKRKDSNVTWEPEAEEALKRVPLVVRPLARSKIEEAVRAQGRERVSLADYQEAERRMKPVMGDKADKELAALMPAENRPGVEMVVINACRSRMSRCPNVLLDTGPWQQAVEKVLREGDFSERLRAKVDGAQVLFHHKLKISLCGCPNGCSRPQIADIGLVGFVRPRLDNPDDCIACGLCAQACPDQAIALDPDTPAFDRGACQGCNSCSRACGQGCIGLSPAGMRVLLGGRLGRHPRLARPVREVDSPKELETLLRGWLEDYLQEAGPGERFSHWWERRGREGARASA